MWRLAPFVSLSVVAACAPTSPPPAPPTQVASPEAPATDTPAPAPAGDASGAEAVAPTEPPPPKPPADMAAWCKAACERNGATCDSIDVPACATNCTTAFGGVVDFCPVKVATFTSCVDASETRCKAGAKLRPQGCDDESFAVAGCIMLNAMKPEERCVSHCTDFGQCEIVEGACTATSEGCEKVEECKGGKCEIVDNICTPKEP